MAQLVEHILGKDEVTSSNLVISSSAPAIAGAFSFYIHNLFAGIAHHFIFGGLHMNISINPTHFKKAAVWETERTLTEAIDLVYDAGFRHFDLEAETLEDAETIAAHIKDKNVRIIQSHMPFNRYKKIPTEVFRKNLMDCATYAKMIGAEILVVHGDKVDDPTEIYTAKEALEYNHRFFYDLVTYAEKNGMRVAFENTFQESTKLNRPHYCAFVEDLCALVDSYGTKNVGICWDSGHAKVQYYERDIDALRLAGDRVICTHIHDNYFSQDMHAFPFLGEIHWKDFMQTLKDIGYTGDLSLEFVYDRLPKALAPDYLKLLYRTGAYLANEVTK